jgi:anti-sigma B factor antagonist
MPVAGSAIWPQNMRRRAMSSLIDQPMIQAKFPFICSAGRIESLCSDDRIAISVAGEVDASATTRLNEYLHDAIDRRMSRVVLDLAAVTYMDSRALTVLIHAHRRMAELGCAFAIIGTAPLNIRLFNAAGIASYLSDDQGQNSS